MATWHRLGTEEELLARVPFATKVERHRIAVDRALQAWRVPDRHAAEFGRPMPRAGRKASSIETTDEVMP